MRVSWQGRVFDKILRWKLLCWLIFFLFFFFFKFLGSACFVLHWQLLLLKPCWENSTLWWRQRRSCSPCSASLGETLYSPPPQILPCSRILGDFSFHVVLFWAASLSGFGFFQETKDIGLELQNNQHPKRCLSLCCHWEPLLCWGLQATSAFQMESQSCWQLVIVLKFIGPISTTFTLDT